MGKSKEKDLANTDPEAAGDDQDRGTWGSPVEFVLSCLGYAVGLGNVWRFPYLCYENGGGAFLIPYAIMLTFVGIPCFLIELSLGQYTGAGPLEVWKVSPLFRGIGAGMLIISFIGCIYYNMIIGWSLYYMFASFQKLLPWATCTHDYNTESCYSKTEAENCEKTTGSIFYNLTCYNETDYSAPTALDYTCKVLNFTSCKVNQTESDYNCTFNEFLNQTSSCLRSGASEEYFNYGMLRRSPTIDEGGDMIWQLVLVLLLAWIMCFLCVIKGIKSSGKAVYFTATFPYVVLIILFIRGILLEGSYEGIKFYIIPDWSKLATAKVWVDAAGQIFFSLSVGMGGLMTFASYNKFNNNVYRDTLIVAIANCLTSFFAGFVIFSIIGHMAHVLGKDVDDVASSGSGLAFIAYPEVVTYLPISQLWSVLFFFMLLTLGLDSQFAGIENLMTAFVDTFPQFRPKKTLVSAVLCTILFIMGLSMCMQSGVYWLELMGYYSSGWSLVLIGLAESAVIGWAYGARKLMANIERMVGFKLYIHWWICLTFVTPVLLIAILIFNIIDTTPLSYGDYELPQWAQILGWLMAVSSVAMIPVLAVYEIYKSYGNPDFDGLHFGRRLLKLTQPGPTWKAAVDKDREPDAAIEQNEMPPPYPYPVSGDMDSKPKLAANGMDNPGYDISADSHADVTRL